MVTLKKDWEIDIMRLAGRIVASVLELLRERIQPGSIRQAWMRRRVAH